MDNETIDFNRIREFLNVLYNDKDTLVSDLSDDVNEIYTAMQSVMKILEENNGAEYTQVVNIIKEFEDKTFMPNTVGEYLFACINMSEADKCIKDCNDSIKESINKFSKCAFPVYRVDQYGVIELIYNEGLLNPGNPNDRTDTAVVLVDPNQGLSNDAISALRSNNFQELHLYNRSNNRYVGKYILSNGQYRPELPTATPAPLPTGKKGKVPGKNGKKKGKEGKSEYWQMAGYIGLGILAIAVVWYFANTKKGKGGNGNQVPAQQPRVPRYPQSNGRRCYQFS